MVAIQWVGPPRAYTKGRPRPVQFVVLHYTAGSEGPTSAEAGARYDKTRTDGTSTHYFTDSLGPALQEVADGDRAHTARQHGNDVGIQIEICGTAQTRAQWLDAVSTATLKTTAELVAVLLKRHNLPLRRMSTAEVRQAYYGTPGSRPKGICDHSACTKAFPEDRGTHTDVGPAFPWDVFLSMVAAEMGGTTPAPPTGEDDDEMKFFAITDHGPKFQYAGRYQEGLLAMYEFADNGGELDAWRGSAPTKDITHAQFDAGAVGTLDAKVVRALLAGAVAAPGTPSTGDGKAAHKHSLDAAGADTGPAIWG